MVINDPLRVERVQEATQMLRGHQVTLRWWRDCLSGHDHRDQLNEAARLTHHYRERQRTSCRRLRGRGLIPLCRCHRAYPLDGILLIETTTLNTISKCAHR